MYSYMIASTDFQSCTEDGEALAITMSHLKLLFHLLGADYNILSKLMLQKPYDSLRVTYSQALQVSFGHGTLVGLNLKYEEHPLLSYQCISLVLHGPKIDRIVVHIPELVENIPLLSKKKIHPNIVIYFGVNTNFCFSFMCIF